MTDVGKSSSPKTDTHTKVKTQEDLPKMYNVIVWNDDYTTMEFVVQILQCFFSKSREEAVRIMLQVHREGMGIAGVYVKEIAEAKCVQVHQAAEAHGFPLRCTLMPE